jgi:glycerol-3-phosphate dehydrogenase (NAD(P)+)
MVAAGKLDPASVPLMLTMIDIVCHDAPVEFPWDKFFAGDVR